MSGYCLECDRLTKIERRKERGRPAALYPEQHPALGEDTGGRECPGTRRAVWSR
jgi:hypothetical protein